MSNKRVRIVVTGRVQGVFFRQSLKIIAKKNNIFGWVKNLKDGSVESVLEGNTENVRKTIDWAHIGPANSIVDNVEIHNEKFITEFSKFDILY
jgi:acylphosphatase